MNPVNSTLVRRSALVGIDVLLLSFAWLLAYLFRFEFSIPSYELGAVDDYRSQALLLLPWVVLTHILFFWLFHLYRGIVRFVSTAELKAIGLATLINVVLWTVFNIWVQHQETFFQLPVAGSGDDYHVLRIPFSILGSYFFISIFFTGGLRFTRRIWAESRVRAEEDIPATLVVGAGGLAENALRDMLRSRPPRFRPVCAVSVNRDRVGSNLQGVRVRGTIEQIPSLLKQYEIKSVLIALEDDDPAVLRKVVRHCQDAKADFHIIPTMKDIASGRVEIHSTRPVQLQDLLGREPVSLNLPKGGNYLAGETVAITGAGGSIGSELARQILWSKPRQLLLLGKGENSIHEIYHELLASSNGVDILPIIADVRDESSMFHFFEEFRPTIIFHAAAHKHVPLMETEPQEAVKNNVLGTAILSFLSSQYGVKRFVLISSDKAVRPTSVMGATKRLAEMAMFSLARESETTFQAVRFGNVLGSRGSVVPMFERQIARRGPVTVTHPDVSRFFMTIPEAVSLVLHSGLHPETGSLFLLDMGQPVKILDIVRHLITLSGLKEGTDIQIKYTGLRPGEKLHEELLTKEEGAVKTEIGKVWVTKPKHVPAWSEMQFLLKELRELADDADKSNLLTRLEDVIPDYHSGGLDHHTDREALDHSYHEAETSLDNTLQGIRNQLSLLDSSNLKQGDMFGDPSAESSSEDTVDGEEDTEEIEAEALLEAQMAAMDDLFESTEESEGQALTPGGDAEQEKDPSEGGEVAAGSQESEATGPAATHAPAVKTLDEQESVEEGAVNLQKMPPVEEDVFTEEISREAEALEESGKSATQGAGSVSRETLEHLESEEIAATQTKLSKGSETPEGKEPETMTQPQTSGGANGEQLVFLALLEEVPAEAVSQLFADLAGKIDTGCQILVSGIKSLDPVPESIRGQAKLLPDNLKGHAAIWNAAVKESPSDSILISVGPAVRLNGGFCNEVRNASKQHPDAQIFYANHFTVKGSEKTEEVLHNHEGCPHERFDFGEVIMYRTESIRKAGMFDESLEHAWEYDMHTKLMEEGPFIRIASPIYSVVLPDAEEGKAGALYSPGRGKLGGFSYVFYPADVEREVTSVFEKALKRWGAWLDHDTVEVPQPKEKPEVLASVVIPILNRKRFIGNAIEKVLEGTFKDVEVIVIDNGSTDGTQDVVRQYAEKDPRVRLLEGTGNCIASALNDGIRAARGKYICQLDSDDEYVPTTLEKMIGHLENHPKCGLAISYYRLVNEDGQVIEDVDPITHSGYTRNQILRRDGAGALRVFPKTVLEEFGLYDVENYGNFGEDYDMVVKTGEKYDVDRVHEVLYHYRRHGDNTDVIRAPEMKYKNKNNARQNALRRRREINKRLGKI